jgi:hypothetical protein
MRKVDKILTELGLPAEALPLEEVIELKPKRRERERGPCGKVTYPSESQADDAVNAILRTKRGNTSALRTYFCHECNAWHMSSSFFRK